MSVLNRTKKLLSRTWDETMQSFKNPRAEMEQAIVLMKQSVFSLKRSAATCIQDMKLLERRIKDLQEEKQEWGRQAQKAVGAGQDDLARRALLQKKEYEHKLFESYKKLNDIDENTKVLKEELKRAELKLSEFQNKRKLMIYNETFSKTGIKRIGSNIHSLENHFKEMEANSEAKSDKTNKTQNIDEELAALKKKIQKINKNQE